METDYAVQQRVSTDPMQDRMGQTKKCLTFKELKNPPISVPFTVILRETGLSVEKTFFGQILFGQHGSNSSGNQRAGSNGRPGKFRRPCSQCSNESQIGLVPRRSRDQIYNVSNEGFCPQHGRDHQNTDCCGIQPNP